MAKLVSMDWVAERLGHPEFSLVDARRPMRYLSGHLPGAINIAASTAFGPDGRLLEPESLAQLIGNAGLGQDSSAIVYDSPEGQNAAMMAWILEYLGGTDVHVLDSFFEAWKASGREVRYRPVSLPKKTVMVRLNASMRATLEEVRDGRGMTFVDFRSDEEYRGTKTLGQDSPGHIPGAVNIIWRDLAIPPQRILKSAEELSKIANAAGLKRGDNVVAYCRSGPRAALGYLALSQVGVGIRLFDGSLAQWSQAGLPVEK
jgi:thiosulfate/3-mercaptopyruvate sulfurtransferase